MQELIKVATDADGKQVVSARELYDFLGLNKAAFARWAKKNIEENSFAKESEDWEGFNIVLNGNESKDYALSLDFSKRLSMMARTEKGEEARNYFIECEKQTKKAIQPMSQLDILAMSVALLQEQAKKIEEVNNRIDKIEAKQLTSGIDYYTVVGFASLNKVKVTPSQANILGRKCSSRSRSMGVPKQDIHDPRYGLVGGYHEEILEFVFMQEGYL